MHCLQKRPEVSKSDAPPRSLYERAREAGFSDAQYMAFKTIFDMPSRPPLEDVERLLRGVGFEQSDAHGLAFVIDEMLREKGLWK